MPSLSVNPIRGRRPVLQNCTIVELEVDPTYQRSIDNGPSQALIRAIARDWDWRLCQPLVVGHRREEGADRLFVVDGQHRLAAARLRGDVYDLPCVVTDYEDRNEEVANFVELNRRRRPLGALDLFKAEVARGEDSAVEIMSLLAAAGLSLAPHTKYDGWKPGQLGNVSGLRRAHREHGADVVGRALAILGRAYQGQVLRYAGTIFPGLATALAQEPPDGADDALLEMVLGGGEQSEWSRDIGAIAAERGIHNRKAAAIAIRNAWQEAAVAMLDEAA